MAKLSTDIGTSVALHPRENIFRTTSLASVSADTAIRADGAQSFVLSLSGTFVATLLVEGSNDGTNFFSVPMRPYNTASKLYVVSATAVGQFVGVNPGFSQLRVRCSAYTSGTANFTISASTGELDQTLEGAITASLGTAVGAAGAAVTLTLAAPGAGLRHYITYLSVNRFASLLLVAAAAPVTVTTTNLPGSLALSFPADAAAAGTLFPWREDFAYALASSAQNTATTIVAPLTTSVIWRITAGFYVAP